ncbi:PKD-like family lipoprotein [Desertivirga brevis]|uniref:PKD-like family lipoprotein n=1 Tax=Desertivirga brevis TaxID=2810310 RepID=UPI001A95CFAB|nr:PKD-like family lipoprotein [Pedobacter sp. SYSU D00873]
MKKISEYIFPILFLLVSGFTACKKDLGNYDYSTNPLPAIDTTGIGYVYTIERYDSLFIAPKVSYAGMDTTRLKYNWVIYKVITGSTSEVQTRKLIASQKELRVQIAEAVGNYKVELVVTDSVNKLVSNIRFDLTVASGIEYGWMVLHTFNGESDLDFVVSRAAMPVATQEKHLRNIYSQSTGKKLPGEGRFIAQSRRTTFSAPIQNWLTIGSPTQLSRIHGNDFSLMRENTSLFQRPGEVINPQAFLMSSTNSNEVLINNNKLYFSSSPDPLGALFPGALIGDYSLAPYIADASSSSIIAAVYDEKYQRFLHPVNGTASIATFREPANPAQPFNLNNVGKSMIGMDRGFQNQTLNFLKDPTGNGRWLYITNFNKTDDGLMAVSKIDMTSLPEIAAARYFQSSEFGYASFYATERSVYLYDYLGSNTASRVLNYSAQETITSMKIFKPRPTFNLTTTDGRFLYVATWDGTIGRLYEYSINPTSGQVTTTPTHTYTIQGKVVDMCPKARGAGII